MEQRENKTIHSIQALRGLAALSVVLFHYRFYLVPEGSDRSLPDNLFSWGAIGVDLFFVLSGFIMVLVTRGKGHGLKVSKQFIQNRLIRILPVYYIILFLALLTNGAMSTFHYTEKVDNLISALTFQPYMLKSAPLYVLENGLYNIRWTLNFELYFYIAFSICLLFKRNIIPLSLWFIAPLVSCYALFGNITFLASGYQFHSVWLAFITNPMILEFGMGVVTGYIYTSIHVNFSKRLCFTPIIVLLGVALGIYTKELTAYNLLSGICFSVLILAFALWDEAIKDVIPSALITLGNISFSLYLLHAPLASAIAGKVNKATASGLNSTAGFMFLVSVALIAAWVSHRYLEIKLTNAIKRKFVKQTKPLPGLSTLY